MNKLVVVVLILSMAVVANAGLVLSINGEPNPPDSTITIQPSDVLEVGVVGNVSGGAVAGTYALGLNVGSPGSLDASHVVGGTAVLMDNAVAAEALGIQNPFISLDYQGAAISGFLFHCDGPGDVTLYLIGDGGLIADTQVIHQIPEPMTLALLGLGGLSMAMFRKRSA